MGEAKRRKLAGDLPSGPKPVKYVHAKRADHLDVIIGNSATASMMAMLMAAKLRGGRRFP